MFNVTLKRLRVAGFLAVFDFVEKRDACKFSPGQ